MTSSQSFLSSIDAIIFDLDGTLWDASRACANAWNQVLEKNSIPFRKVGPEEVRKVSGKPHAECIKRVFQGLPDQDIRRITEDTKVEDVRVISEKGGAIYPGVIEGIQTLQKSYPLFIVSNCQKGYIETFYHHSGLAHLFSDSECWGNTGKPKADNLRSVILRNHLKSPIYVGDTEGDQLAARQAGVLFAHAQYGFGDVSRADFTLKNFHDLVNLLGGAH